MLCSFIETENEKHTWFLYCYFSWVFSLVIDFGSRLSWRSSLLGEHFMFHLTFLWLNTLLNDFCCACIVLMQRGYCFIKKCFSIYCEGWALNTRVCCIAGEFFTVWANSEAHDSNAIVNGMGPKCLSYLFFWKPHGGLSTSFPRNSVSRLKLTNTKKAGESIILITKVDF